MEKLKKINLSKGKKEINLNRILEKIVILFFVLYAFWGLQPYFTWKQYKNGKFAYIGNSDIPIMSLFGALAVFFGICLVLKKNKIAKNNIKMFIFTIIISILVVMFSGGISHMLSFEWLIFLVPAIFILLPEMMRARTYNLYYSIISISLIIPIIIYILVHVGVNVPYILIKADEGIKVNNGYTYRIYPFASQWSRYNISYYSFRLCGIYNESGLLGTISALLLAQQEFKIKNNWKNIILLISGILSFSLAFYSLVAVYFIAQMLVNSDKKKLIIIFMMFIVYLIFINIKFSNENIANFQSRMILTSNGFSGDTRTNPLYDELFDSYLKSDIYTIVFGNGHGALEEILKLNNIDGCSYKTLLYDYGIIGFSMQFIWLAIYVYSVIYRKENSIKKYGIVLLLVYIVNMYQRPSMFAFHYIIIVIGGMYSKVCQNVNKYNVI